MYFHAPLIILFHFLHLCYWLKRDLNTTGVLHSLTVRACYYSRFFIILLIFITCIFPMSTDTYFDLQQQSIHLIILKKLQCPSVVPFFLLFPSLSPSLQDQALLGHLKTETSSTILVSKLWGRKRHALWSWHGRRGGPSSLAGLWGSIVGRGALSGPARRDPFWG